MMASQAGSANLMPASTSMEEGGTKSSSLEALDLEKNRGTEETLETMHPAVIWVHWDEK